MSNQEAGSLKSKTLSGLIWSGIERFAVQGIQMVIKLALARLLMPDDFAVVAILIVFIQLSIVLTDSGFSNALIRKYNPTEGDYSTSFYFNLAIGVFLYLFFFSIAPFIANFYEMPILKPLMRFMALFIIFDSLSIVQRAKFTIAIDFKTQAKASLPAVLISGSIAIGLAIYLAPKGLGAWALAIQMVTNNAISTALYWYFSKWYPKKGFSLASFKELFGYGWKILLSSLIDSIYQNIATLIIGKKFSKHELGYYTNAGELTRFPSQTLTGILQRVTFPMLSSIQDDHERLREAYRKLLRLSAYVVFPLMIGLAAIASPFVLSILSEKWRGSIELIQLLCFSAMWFPIHAINLNLLQVKGRSDLFLKLEIYKKIIGFTILIICIPFGVKAICIGSIISSLFALVINTYYTGKLINVGLFRQLKDLLPTLIYSLSMGAVVILVTSLFSNTWLQLFAGIAAGAIYYLLISVVTRSKELNEVLILAKIKK